MRQAAPLTLRAYVEAMRRVPGALFPMGTESGHEQERPVHPVALDPFRIGAVPVTVAIWREYVRATPALRMPEAPEAGWFDDHPIVNVTWGEVAGADGRGGFVGWASRASGLALRLPTEAEWECAAREGGKPLEFPWGPRFDVDKLWCSVGRNGQVEGTVPVHRAHHFHVNALGIADLAGNVWEWTADWFGDYPAPRPDGAPQRNPRGPARGDARVIRGGSFLNGNPTNFRCANRTGSPPTGRGNGDDLGFRLAVSVS